MGTRGGVAAERFSEKARLKVLYDFEYETRGKRVKIIKDEKLLLLKRTNDDWWQVVRPADVNNCYIPEQSTFYVPTGYVHEEDALPEGTRFYVDKDRMFKSTEGSSQATVNQQHSTQDKDHQSQEHSPKEEPRKTHDSFRSVIRKLSGNLGSVNDSNRTAKPAKPSKIIKLRKNSVESNEDVKLPTGKSSLVSTKNKDTWESSAFGMCFGRDMKNVDAQVLNPFQEELENALSNRLSQRKTILDTKLGISKPVDQVCDEKEKPSKFENVQEKWVKASAHLKKPDTLQRPDNFHFVPLSKIKEDAQKRRSASPNFPQNEITNNVSSAIKRLSESDKLYSVVEKTTKKPAQLQDQNLDIINKNVDQNTNIINENSEEKIDIINKSASPVTHNKTIVQDNQSMKDIDRELINDKRKMWAIETLMSELLQSSTNSKSISSGENNEVGISGPNQLAQELHEMSVSRRFENAEIQVNLLDVKTDNTKENDQLSVDKKLKVESRKKKVFDFPPRTSVLKAPKSPTARSPKLLDEYNEANILNDNDRPRDLKEAAVEVVDYKESPSYSNVCLHIKREKVPYKLKMPPKDFKQELQLTPSLEKLASEIKFLPASMNSMEFETDKFALDMDQPTTTLSQDSLRLYKRRSKSDGALNKRDPRRRGSVDSGPQEANPTEASKAAERRCAALARAQQQQEALAQRQSAARYSKLNRKSRSLGDLDCSEVGEEAAPDATGSTCELESRRRYKPVPKLRSKESFRRLKPSAPLLTPTASTERLLSRPVPAKRRINHQQQPQPCDSSYDDLSEIDIDRSTAVGFKTLLRTSDSGSEEYLQYKTFPATGKSPQLSPYEHSKLVGAQNISRSDGNVNLSRSLSDEAILSSTNSCSSASPSRLLDGSIENLVELPLGWTQSYDSNAKRVCFLNDRGDKWFSSNDSEGKIYFFEENSNESSWALPAVINQNRVRTISNNDWPQLFDGNMCILKEGVINKTKITTENGKKLRKTWSTSYAVLTELFLLFFKDAKTFDAMKMDQSAAAKPDISVDLNGAFIESAEKLSNRKNVYLINTLLGLQVLVQWDNALVIAEWYREIHDTIQRLPFSQEYGRSSSSRE